MIRRRLAAAFVCWHLFAIVLGALPPPERFSNSPVRDLSLQSAPVLWAGTTLFDGLAAAVAPLVSGIWRVTRPVRPAVNWYLRLTGLGQSWAMFSNPPQVDQYVRVRYYVQPRSGDTWTATELVMPAHREDRVRLFQSYRDSYRDKAIAIALDAFYRNRRPSQIVPDAKPEQLPDDLAPIARYFRRTYEARHLAGTGARVIRTEVWVGNAPIPPMGTPIDRDAHAARRAALSLYWAGPVEQRVRAPGLPPYHGLEEEADIDWLLEYYEEP